MKNKNLIDDTIAAIAPFDETAARKAAARLDALLKPPGSLGRLEELAVTLAGVQGCALPEAHPKIILIYAADHGVCAEKVSAAPSSITALMARAFCKGQAAVNVLAAQAGAKLRVIDMGIAEDDPLPKEIISRRIRRGTANLLHEPSMSREEAMAALAAGIETAQAAIRNSGAKLVGIGEMGIGNTTAAAALTAAFTSCGPAEAVGRGTGLNDAALAHKIWVVEEALRLHCPYPRDVIGTLAKLGGLEIAGMAGAMLGAAAEGALVLIDGFISAAAALAALGLAEKLKRRMVLSHLSAEPGHGVIAHALGMKPLLDLNMRLGEGTGTALSMTLIESAAAVLKEMGTLAEEGVELSGPDISPG
ncbi:MAG: nicotinate-nucleotide--dimethylbenzimidazole phosphoribosyltransferase [Spirochaeta sp. LUC14_002_19_P3]|nr:MAG: nicotinate-nucleotide--dimethylbenzimidazole phosphoribosyltransferase [Spirochaeta sp. LUC14_002_19_P3]